MRYENAGWIILAIGLAMGLLFYFTRPEDVRDRERDALIYDPPPDPVGKCVGDPLSGRGHILYDCDRGVPPESSR